MRSKKGLVKTVIFFGDLFFLLLALFLALAIYYQDWSFGPGPFTKVFVFRFLSLSLVWFLFLFLLDFYRLPPLEKFFDFLYNLAVFFFLGALTGASYFYFQPTTIIAPRFVLVLTVFLFCLFLFIWRFFLKQIFKKTSFLEERIVFIGSLQEIEIVKKLLSEKKSYSLKAVLPISSLFEETAESGQKPKIIFDFKKLEESYRQADFDSLVLGPSAYLNHQLFKQLACGSFLERSCADLIDLWEMLDQKVPEQIIDNYWIVRNLIANRKRIEEIFKRAFDFVFSLVGLCFAFIITPLIALAIKLDSKGPIFYSQKRIGRYGAIFVLYKFRTMKENAEKNGAQWAAPCDERVTTTGKFLRFSRLDELPQLYNILKGEMSFVGPRPERPEFLSELIKRIPYYELRHLMKPGITGWAQVNYPATASVDETKEKLAYDLYYLKNFSLLLDISIILKTLKALFIKKN